MIQWYEVRKWGKAIKNYCENECGQIINSKRKKKKCNDRKRREGEWVEFTCLRCQLIKIGLRFVFGEF